MFPHKCTVFFNINRFIGSFFFLSIPQHVINHLIHRNWNLSSVKWRSDGTYVFYCRLMLLLPSPSRIDYYCNNQHNKYSFVCLIEFFSYFSSFALFTCGFKLFLNTEDYIHRKQKILYLWKWNDRESPIEHTFHRQKLTLCKICSESLPDFINGHISKWKESYRRDIKERMA